MNKKGKPPIWEADDVDWLLVKELEEDCRQSNHELARKLGMAPTTVHRRLRRLFDGGVINAYLVIHPPAVGFRTRAFMGLNIRPGASDSVVEQLQLLWNVQAVTLTTGCYDIFIFTVFRDPEEMTNFISKELGRISDLVNVEDMMVMKVTKRLWWQARPVDLGKEIKPRVLDEAEIRLIKELEGQPRETAANLGRKLGMSRRVVSRKLATLINDKVISVVGLVNPEALGFGVRATVFLKVHPGAINSVADILSSDERVQHAVIVSGQFKIFFYSVFYDIEELSSFLRDDLSKIPGVIHYETTIQLAQLKQSAYLG